MCAHQGCFGAPVLRVPRHQRRVASPGPCMDFLRVIRMKF